MPPDSDSCLTVLGVSAEEGAEQVFRLYQRHAEAVVRVVVEGIAGHAAALAEGSLPLTCLLRLVCDRRSLVVPAPAPAFTVPTHYFVRPGESWAVRFAGQRMRTYLPDRGFEYLHLLVERPGVLWTAAQLACAADRRTRTWRGARATRARSRQAGLTVGAANAPELMDEEGRRRCRVRLQEIVLELAKWRESTDPKRWEKTQELEAEQRWIADALREARGLGGRSRRLGDERNQVRNRVCNAIRRSLQSIEKYDAALAAHLRQPILKLGHTIRYSPPEGVVWTTDAAAIEEADGDATPRVASATNDVAPVSVEARPGE